MRRRLSIALASLLATSLTLVVAPGPSGAATSLTQQAKWYTPTFASGLYDTDLTGEAFSSPAVGDVTGDGNVDIVAGYQDGKLRIWSTSGTLVKEIDTGPGAIQSSPALIDLNGDGTLDILTSNLAGRVVAFTSAGSVIFSKTISGCGPCEPGFFATPTAADIDKDGVIEIVAGGFSQFVYAWNLDGSNQPGFPRDVQDTVWSSPALADLDGDGYQEIVVGADCDGVPGQHCYPDYGGYLWVFRHDGSNQPGWPRFIQGQVVWSSPAVADLTGDGKPEIVVGTGLFDPAPGGQKVYGFDRSGNTLPGWPVNVGGRTMSSPAVGDVDNDGSPDVAIMADDGRVYVIGANGGIKPGFPQCNANNRGGCPVGLHASVVLADLDGNGGQEVIAAGEHYLRVYGAGGVLKAETSTEIGAHPATGAPSVAQINGKAWILLSTVFKSGSTYRGTLWAWTTNAALGRADWPTFKQNFARSGSIRDSKPPTASLGSLPASSSTTKVNVTWSGTDADSGVANFDVDVKDGAGPWVRWLDRVGPASRSGTSASGGHDLYGAPGHSYSVRVRARDRAGNVSPWTASATTAFTAGATSAGPVKLAYAGNAFGSISALSSPPVGGPDWSWPAGRDLATARDGGGYVLDAFGGVQPFGGAPALSVSGYWPGWDIARKIVLNPDGKSGYVMDAYAGLHALGGAVKPSGLPYWPNWTIAREIVLTPSSTKSNPAGYILDAFGGIHAFGSAPKIAAGGYWVGWDIARDLALSPSDPTRGYVLDAWGALHPFGGAPKVKSGGYWVNWDIARDVELAANGQSGWVMDGYGGIHRFGGAPTLDWTRYWPIGEVAKGFSVVL